MARKRTKKDQVMLESLNVSEEDGRHHVEMVLKHPNFSTFAMGVAGFFHKEGGVNFVEMKVYDAISNEVYMITVQKAGNPTPAEVASIMREALKQIESGIGTPAHVARVALDAVGYKREGKE